MFFKHYILLAYNSITPSTEDILYISDDFEKLKTGSCVQASIPGLETGKLYKSNDTFESSVQFGKLLSGI